MRHAAPDTIGPHELRAVFERCAIGLAVLDEQSQPLWLNDALCELLGASRQAVMAGGPLFIGTASEAAQDARQRAALLAGGAGSPGVEREHHRPDGSVLRLRQLCAALPATTARGRLLLLQLEDLTEAHALRRALHDAEERWRHTFDGAALGIAHVDLRGNIVRVNRRLCEMNGYRPDELVGSSAFDLMADHGQAAGGDMAGLLRGQWRHYSAERQYTRKNGETYPVHVSVSIVRPAGGEPYFISMVEDITKQKDDERRLRRQARMLDSVNDAVVIHQEDRRIRYWNRVAESLFGWRAQQALGRTFAELLGPQSAISDEALAQLMREGALVVRVRCRRPDGRELLVERRLTVVEGEDAASRAVLSVNSDITPPAT